MTFIKYQLNEMRVQSIPVFKGKSIFSMPKLISSGYMPISSSEIMEQRIIASNKIDNSDLKKDWLSIPYNSGDSVIYHPEGRIKIVYDSPTLRAVDSYDQLGNDGSLILDDGYFREVPGPEFSKNEVELYTGCEMKKKDVLNNPIWLASVRGDKHLFTEYVNMVFSLLPECDKLMNLFISNQNPNFENEKLLSLGGIGNGFALDGSGTSSLNYFAGGYLIGVRKRDYSNIKHKKNLERKLN